ncbi:MAG: antibiotic biosynthesis monooxygenase [Hoeflea sp.]|nr:antibiotic biosynthesis monooxygenase [Hoeflea sp.]|tara:strand:+ start:126 stop:449 length:324 start_codon:yes stop_codon:yes gene_type:complete
MSELLLRIDRFEVPLSARDEFMTRIVETHAVLHSQPGLNFDRIVERRGDDGSTIIITIAEWKSAEAIDAAAAAVRKMREATDFSPAAFIEANGIRADIGVYAPVAGI